jgi:hypothetical protein
MAVCLGANVACQVGVAPGDVGPRSLDNKLMNIACVAFGRRCLFAGQLADIADGVVVIEGFKVIFERFVANSNPCSMTRVVSTGLRVFPSMAFDA